MVRKVVGLIFLLTLQCHYRNAIGAEITDETELEEYIRVEYEATASQLCYDRALANWNYVTNVNEDTKKAYDEMVVQNAQTTKELWQRYFSDLDIDSYSDNLKRQLKSLKNLGSSALDEVKLTELQEIKSSMQGIYSAAKICPYEMQDCDMENGEGITLDPDIEEILATSDDVQKLEYVWKAWRDASGAPIREQYKTYVDLSNEAALLNGFGDMGELWRDRYETDNFVENLDELWEQVKPLYDELHTYVRRKLKSKHGDAIDTSDGMIPAHILGNMWAQSWVNIAEDVLPYPGASTVDVTSKMVENGYSVEQMFEESNEFFISMGLEDNSMSYNADAMIVKPTEVGREVLCHASAWDFCDRETFRIKMCTNINMEDYITVHHEMGHIQYYLQYKDQPISFRGGANPGFHEAVGDTIALSVATTTYLKNKDLLDDDYLETDESSINSLMDMALERVAFLPFGYLIDKWRWDVFSGNATEEDWNERWWNYRNLYQKVKAPVERTESDFDPGAKYHVPGDSQYINYFVAHILEFQLYRGLCIVAGEYTPDSSTSEPLHKCNFFDSKEAGTKLASGLTLGASKHWSEALELMTGESALDATAILEYFQPLYEYLERENRNFPEVFVQELLDGEYATAAETTYNAQVNAEWNYATDVDNKDAEAAQTTATLNTATFEKYYWTDVFQYLDEEDYSEELLQRQVKFLSVLGNAALDTEDLKELTSAISAMTNIYSTARICKYDDQDCDLAEDGLTLAQGIEEIMKTSEDYDELLYVWDAWRDASGAQMRDSYKTYVELSNKAAEANDFEDKGEMWRSDFESETFIADLDRLWAEVEPLYNELHKYVGRKLQKKYEGEFVFNEENDLIPAHIFGNMWAQSWVNLASLVKPYPEESEVDITQALNDQGYTVLDMFDIANQFYLDLGLEDSSESYGANAMITKPDDREVVCHASAWDFYDGKDFRIKMCTEVNYEDFITIHHELGHIQYFQEYKDLPITLRTGANPGFHEAIGDTIALSVATPKHLLKIGLLDEEYVETEEASINALMDMALERVAFLPFGLLIDKWRWDVFSGDIEESEWNAHWWSYREQYQKIRAPNDRTENHFDPGAKFHVAADSKYISYFVAHILEFQFFKALCLEAGEYVPTDPDKPLHKCDFDGSTEAGTKLREGLQLGASKHWQDVLETITGSRVMDASALLEYFEPLLQFLQEYEEPEFKLDAYLEDVYEVAASARCNARSLANWAYVTDITNTDKQQTLTDVTLKNARYTNNLYEQYFKHLSVDDYDTEELKRQLKSLQNRGSSALDAVKLEEYSNIKSSMQGTYSAAKICPFENQNCNLEDGEGISLEPGIEAILATSDNIEELEYAWKAWREASGAPIREQYKTYVDLSNEAAVLNGFTDMGELWRDRYETDNFVQNLENLWEQVKPLYDELHTYVRRKLKSKYGDAIDTSDGMIPAHILGNMWAQSWVNIVEDVRPYPEASAVDVTSKMAEKGYSVEQMFQESNDFFTSMGLEDNSMSYGDDAMITKPTDEGIEVLCHASAWDFCDGETFRIKMCTEVNMEDYITVHHEMGHIQYFIQYKGQPISFRGGANPGFHEAVGDTIALSVATPSYLRKIGLLDDDDYDDSEEASINSLMDMALERVAFLPFGFLIDKWRWDVFSGEVTEDKWNEHWWKYRNLYQKVKAPVERTESDFDPGAKYHVPGDSQYINYFVAHILEFQLYRGLCIVAGEYTPDSSTSEPLHKCDFYDNKEAGAKLASGLTLGASKHWSEALDAMTGETELDATAILEYFQPLYEYLERENRNFAEVFVQELLDGEYATAAETTYNAQVNAEWNYATDVDNKDAEAAQTTATLNTATFEKYYWTDVFQYLDEEDYSEELLQRQVKFLSVLGNAALDTEDLEELTSAISAMTNIYSTARICKYDDQDCDLAEDGLTLEQGIEDIMKTSEDYDELLYVWEAWRDASGAQMRDYYKTYVELSNKAAEVNGYDDKGKMWIGDFESETFIEDLDALWKEIEPLYKELHIFVGRKLAKKYEGRFEFDEDNVLIPAHIFGNMWAQSWVNLASLVKPYPDASEVDITQALNDQGYTVLKMFDTANEFYTSMGLQDNSMSYGEKAMITKPADRDVVCHASAWDFLDGADFRIKMCTEVNYEDFITIHHELGHIQYYLQYKELPITLRTGANPGFHEAVGDTIALSVATPQHFVKIGLLDGDDYVDNEEATINALMDMALERVAFLPFGLLIDKWRWDVFSGDVEESEWNARWWDYREEYQKIMAPIDRTESHFDPGAKFHVGADYQYISYFVAHVLEFQFYKALCLEAGEYVVDDPEKPLHKCDFFNSVAAGKKLSDGLSLGASKQWEDVLETITGERTMNASALMEYFDPLYVYLVKANDSVNLKFSHMTCIWSLIVVYLLPHLIWYK